MRKPEQQEIERLHRELARMKAERDFLKSGGLLYQGPDMTFESSLEAPRDLAGVVDLRSARCCAHWL